MKKLTYEYVKEYVESFGYKLLSEEYKNSQTPLLVQCEKEHDAYSVTLGNFKKGKRCKQCYYERIKKEKEKRKEVIEKYITSRGYELIEILYIDNYEHVKIKCKKGHEWIIRYDSFKRRNQECYECRNRNKTIRGDKEIEEYIKERGYEPMRIFKKEDNSGRIITYITIKCFNNHEWTTRFHSFRRGVNCPCCNISKGEQEIMNWLEKNNIEYVYDDEYFKDLKGINGGLLRPDFIIEDKRIWIEYDGEFHYKNIYETQNFENMETHDELKNKYAEENGWKLIRIPYWDFDNIEEILEKELLQNGSQ